jgi:uncharacterized caspase-like protein
MPFGALRRIPLCLLILSALAGVASAKTYALLVGVSKYAKLPGDLWLQYPDADIRAFADFLASAKGGSVPPDQIRTLSNDQATTAAVRRAFDSLLKDATGTDTVFVLVAAHGTVDSSGAYILTYDGDPADLPRTALPMGELKALMERQTGRAGHVVLLADVCRAAAIAGQKTTNLAGLVEKIGPIEGEKLEGEMLGLMAARPKELSSEGPEFGGGHGAFTFAVLQGLGGAADANADGVVTAGELIDYVTATVPKLTGDRQHPRDFGNMDNATNLSRPGLGR